MDDDKGAGILVIEEAALPQGNLAAEGNIAAQSIMKTQTIRVNVDKLDQMMNMVGELVIDQTRIRQLEQTIRQEVGPSETMEGLKRLNDRLKRVIGDLQDNIMKVRMLPLSQLFNRFPRMVRDLSRSLEKELDFIVEGSETELDRTLIEEIGDPLIHLIRNAIEHGIERPAARLASGKPSTGILRIRAAHEYNQVVITVEDDGAGIDGDRLRRAAALKGMIGLHEDGALSEQEAVELIFEPGLSTAEHMRGRGRGLDIARTGIERINGRIHTETQQGRGTRFTLRLPLTLTLMKALQVKVGERSYVVPMGSVNEIIKMGAGMTRTIKGRPFLILRNQLIPVLWLHDYLGCARQPSTPKRMSLLVIGHSEQRVALAVDELIGNQDIVVKPLGAFMGQVEGIAGATILGNGQVAPILEIEGIVAKLGRF